MADSDREQVLAFAAQHGTAAASERFEVAAGTIRSWRSRAGGSTESVAPAVKPGDPEYQVAELPLRSGFHEAAAAGSDTILSALTHGGRFVGIPDTIVRSWQARDAGDEPEMDAGDCFDRLRYAFSALPDDLRAEVALECERTAWTYHGPDLDHLRIVTEREAQEHQQAQEKARQERAKTTELQKAEAEAKAEQDRLQHDQAEHNRQRVQAHRQRQADESERMRRASEDLRRNAA